MSGFKITKDNIKNLDDPIRELILPKEKIFEVLGDISGKVIADIGAGTGYYTKDLSALVGTNGQVFAIDVNPELLEQVTFKTKELANVTNVLSNESSIPLEDDFIDIALSINTFHEFDDKELTLKEIKRILKNGSKLLLIDWSQKVDPPPGPPKEHRILKDDVILVIEDFGFNLLSDLNIGEKHYTLIFENVK